MCKILAPNVKINGRGSPELELVPIGGEGEPVSDVAPEHGFKK